MDWTAPAQLLGYAGTGTLLLAALLLALTQRSSLWYWGLAWVGNVLWFAAGWLMVSPAVLLDITAFLPVVAFGTWRAFRA